MSTILKALRRLEEDRQGELQRDLRAAVAARSAPRGSAKQRSNGPWFAAGGGAALAVLGVGAWLVVTGLPPATPERSPVEIRVAPAVPRTATTSARPALARVVVPPPVATSPPLAPATELPPARPTRQPPVPSAGVRMNPPQPEPAFAVVHPKPTPDLRIWKTVWHPNAKRRLAVVELSGGNGPVELREGEALGSLVVVEITPTGVTFDRNGVQWVRRLGESPRAIARGR